jgi:hypothetical protein
MQVEQIAFGTLSKVAWEAMASLAPVIDEVTFSGWFKMNGVLMPIVNEVGYLAFDYTMGLEREYLYYPNAEKTFHGLIPAAISRGGFFLSHLAHHVENIDRYLACNPHLLALVVMDVMTTDHKNEKLIELGRKYRYVIIDQRSQYGYFLKLIQRIDTKPVVVPGSPDLR